jgi:hypothetical protein
MGYGLSGSGNSFVRTTGDQTITGQKLFIHDGDPSHYAIKVVGNVAATTQQLIQVFDAVGNPIWIISNAGGQAMFGDNSKVFRGGEVFNPDLSSLTSVNDHVVTDASGIHLGHGVTAGVNLYVGVGAPTSVNPNSTGFPANGSLYFRSDGGAGTTLYQMRAGAWVPTAA